MSAGYSQTTIKKGVGRGVAKDGSEKCARETYFKKKTKRQTKKKKRLLFSVLHQNLKYPITTAGQPYTHRAPTVNRL